jgi:hypothetical protein
MKRLAGEIGVLVAALAIGCGVILIVGPESPDAANHDFVPDRRFYERLFLAQVSGLLAIIIAYWLLHKVYRRYRARGAPDAGAG